jgi:hypothetical protein
MPAGVSGCGLGRDCGCELGGSVHAFGSVWGHNTVVAVRKHALSTVGYINTLVGEIQ